MVWIQISPDIVGLNCLQRDQQMTVTTRGKRVKELQVITAFDL